MKRNHAIGLVMMCAAVTVLGLVSCGQALAEDFEGFTAGVSVNGQGGWTVEDSFGHDPVEAGKAAYFDEAIVDLGGNKVWRVSNAVAYSEYAFQPFSSTSPLIAGETNSHLYNDYGDDHTSPYSPPHEGGTAATPYFSASFDISSATGAAQNGLSVTISPSAKQSTVRMGYLKISDSGSGLDLVWYGTGTTTDPWAPDYVPVATGLSYTDAHHIDMYISFADGINADSTGNDEVLLYVDHALAATSTTWETYYYGEGEGVTEPRLQAVDSLLFRMSTAAPSLSGGGIYFDNVVVGNTAPVPEPSTLLLLLLGGAGLVVSRVARRRRAR